MFRRPLHLTHSTEEGIQSTPPDLGPPGRATHNKTDVEKIDK